MEGHRDLVVWKRAMLIVTDVYYVTSTFPREELYGLTNQLRRAAVSVPITSPKGTDEVRRRSSTSSCVMLAAHCWKSKRNWRSPRIWGTCQTRQCEHYCLNQVRLAEC